MLHRVVRHCARRRPRAATTLSLTHLHRLNPRLPCACVHVRSVVTPAIVGDRPRATETEPPVAASAIATAVSPAVSMLQDLIAATPSAQVHREVSDSAPSRRQRNRRLRRALGRRDFAAALAELQALLATASSAPTHPVTADNYARLLSLWSTDQSQRNQRVDLAPVVALLELLVREGRASEQLFNTAFTACLHRRALRPALSLLALLRSDGRAPSDVALASLLSCYARLTTQHPRRQSLFVAEADALWTEYLSTRSGEGRAPSLAVVNAMLFVFRSTRGRALDAAALVSRSREDWGLEPDARTVNTLLVTMLKDEEVAEAARFVLTVDLALVDADMLRRVVDACRRAGEWTLCDRLRRALALQGVGQGDRELQLQWTRCRRRDASDGVGSAVALPSARVRTTGTTIRADPNDDRQRRPQLRRALQRVLSARAPRRLPAADSTIDDSQIDALLVAGDRRTWGEALRAADTDDLELLHDSLVDAGSDRLVPAGLRPWLWTQYLGALKQRRRWRRAVDALQALVESGEALRTLDVHAFDNVLQACAQARQPRALRRVWRLLEECRSGGREVPGRPRRPSDDLRPTRKTFEALLSAYAAAGDVDAALDAFHALQRSGFAVEIVHVNGLLKAIAVATQRHVHGGDADDDDDEGSLEQDVEEEEEEEEEEGDEEREKEDEEEHVKELARIALAVVEQETTVRENEETKLLANEATLWLLFRSLRGAASVVATSPSDDEQDDDEQDVFAEELAAAARSLAVALSPPRLSPRVGALAIDTLRFLGDVDGCFELYNAFVSRGGAAFATTDTVRALFQACESSDDLEATERLGLALLEHLVSPEELGLARESDGALSAWRELVAAETLAWAARHDHRRQRRRGSTTENDVGHSTAAATVPASSLFQRVLARLVDASFVSPSPRWVDGLLAAPALAGDVARVQAMVGQLERAGVASLWSSPAVCNRVLQACSVAGDGVRAVETMEHALNDHGVRPDVVTFNTALSALRRALLKRQRQQKAERDASEEDEIDDEDDETGEQDQDDGDAAVPVGSHSASTPWSRIESDLLARVLSLLDEMQTRRVAPTAETFGLAVSICALRGDATGVLAVVDRLQEHATRASRRVGGATQRTDRVLELMAPATLCSYVDACASQGDAARLLALQRELRAPVSRAVVRRLVDALDAVGSWREALQTVKHMKSSYGLAPHASDFAQAMAICNRREAFDWVEPIFVTMQSVYRVAPTAACFVERILALEQRGQWVQATQEFMAMQRACRADELQPSLLAKIALGRYSERGRRLDN
ncbi:hypothetical protein P43SY_003921 [Pythium insidiosum]|uniref:Pentacotripeptide-repeat region of PRORP domain-containing protein n=1 Tax=Pythium insidiosum TaxID=114742 RepID=A0AAD5MDH9_PYTIN|nr:hypothetical protein P43SY_003921 [Pythium insidiosum]